LGAVNDGPDAAVNKQFAKLKAKGFITHIGPDKGGHWVEI